MIHLLHTAYVGPGAGFAFLGSFLILFSAFALVLAALISWPFRMLLRVVFRRKRPQRKTDTRRVIVLGLDGLDFGRVQGLIRVGKLPVFQRMLKSGSLRPLWSTCPPISPVAWTSFMTGVNPGKHRIFDFLTRNCKTYGIELSSARITTTPKGKPVVKNLRGSKLFWNLLGEYGIDATILRVPITYPPERFRGRLLSGMCVPDLLGTQGTYTLISEKAPEREISGRHVMLSMRNHVGTVELDLDDQVKLHKKCRISVRHLPAKKMVEIKTGGKTARLGVGEYSEWMPVRFKKNPFVTIQGIALFNVRSLDPLSIYMSPLHIDPEKPALPVSHPAFYSIYLAKLIGPFATLGLAEDTNALNDGVLDDRAFLDQVYRIHDERLRMFEESIKRTRRGLCACVFDATDRIQHMFTRTSRAWSEEQIGEAGRVMEDLYIRMDAMIGRIADKLGPRDVLTVISDHGFTTFERAVNLNAWLKQEGYLVHDETAAKKDYFLDIQWDRTRAYTFGLSGVFINRKGREGRGRVEPDDVAALKTEIAAKLMELTDPANGEKVVDHVYDTAEVYSGPYRDDGPDLIVGFAKGYRASWEAAVGQTEGPVFSDNEKPWSGDHCVDYRNVPGVLLCSRPIEDDRELRLMDMAPTVLDLFGITPPAYMDGKPIRLKKSCYRV